MPRVPCRAVLGAADCGTLTASLYNWICVVCYKSSQCVCKCVNVSVDYNCYSSYQETETTCIDEELGTQTHSPMIIIFVAVN